MNVEDLTQPPPGDVTPGRRPLLAPPEDFYARNRAWALWTYETVTEAINLYGARGTFTELLNFFADKRRSLAIAYRSHEAELFGVWRDERLPTAQRIRTTFFGPTCPPYDKAVQAYQALLGIEADTPFEGVVRGYIGADVFELTSYKCDATSNDPRGRLWLHTHWRHVPPILNHCRELFAQALEPSSDDAAWATLAQLHWWFTHAMPFARGSTSIGAWLMAYVLRMRGIGNVRFWEDPASMALVSPDPKTYEGFLRANVELLPGTGTHIPESPERVLAHYARTGQSWRLRALLKRLPANSREPTGYTALHMAAMAGRAGAASALLSAGAAPLVVVDESKETPLHLAAREGHLRVVRQLVRAGAPLNVEDASGATPLQRAARGGHAWVVWWLLRRGASYRVPDSLGRLPLHYAVERGFVGIVRMLTAGKRRRSINHLDVRGETPLSLAALRGHMAVAQLLIKRGGQPPAQDPHLFAIRLGHRDTALLKEPIDINLYSLMRRVRERGHMEMHVLMLKRLLGPLTPDTRQRVVALLEAGERPAPEVIMLTDNMVEEIT